jgi:S-layer protein (TIGR01564 family)
MRLRKAIKKIVALGIGTTMLGATLMGAMAYDLKDYPSPIIKDGKMNGLLVVGKKAVAADVLGIGDIATSLQFAAKTVSTVTASGGGKVVVSGDNVPFSTSSDNLELNETLGNVRETMTESDLMALKGGVISTDQGTTDYNQYLRFKDGSAIQTGRVIYGENDDNEVGDFLYFKESDILFEYEIEFEEGIESDIQSGTYDLTDIEDEVVNILGTQYSIVETDAKTATDVIKLDFISGEVHDTMEEGQIKTFTISGKDYEVEVIVISDNARSGEGEVSSG